MKMMVFFAALFAAVAVFGQCADGCVCSNCYGKVEISAYAPVGVPCPPDFVPYHVHIELVEAISNLVDRVSAIEARYRRVEEMRSAAKKRAAEKVPEPSVRKRVNELNEILKKRYKEKKK